jgi:hypothetical protein
MYQEWEVKYNLGVKQELYGLALKLAMQARNEREMRDAAAALSKVTLSAQSGPEPMLS